MSQPNHPTIPSTSASRPALAIHGGAGHLTRAGLEPGRAAACHAVLAENCERGYRLLEAGAPALAAVEAAVVVLEDSPLSPSSMTSRVGPERGEPSGLARTDMGLLPQPEQAHSH